MTCVTCRYYQLVNGTCHKNAPHPVHGFASVKLSDWCGEYESEAQAAPLRATVVTREMVHRPSHAAQLVKALAHMVDLDEDQG
jgi:hypothetical protein